MQSQPENAWPAEVREYAKGRRAQVEGRVRCHDLRQGQTRQLRLLPLRLAEKVQRQVRCLRLHPSHRPAFGRKRRDLRGDEVLNILGQGDREKQSPRRIDRIGRGRADLG